MTTKTVTTTDVSLTREDEALVEKMKERAAKKSRRPIMPPLMAAF